MTGEKLKYHGSVLPPRRENVAAAVSNNIAQEVEAVGRWVRKVNGKRNAMRTKARVN